MAPPRVLASLAVALAICIWASPGAAAAKKPGGGKGSPRSVGPLMTNLKEGLGSLDSEGTFGMPEVGAELAGLLRDVRNSEEANKEVVEIPEEVVGLLARGDALTEILDSAGSLVNIGRTCLWNEIDGWACVNNDLLVTLEEFIDTTNCPSEGYWEHAYIEPAKFKGSEWEWTPIECIAFGPIIGGVGGTGQIPSAEELARAKREKEFPDKDEVPVVACVKPFFEFTPPLFEKPRIIAPEYFPKVCRLFFGVGDFFGGQVVAQIGNPFEFLSQYYDLTPSEEEGEEAEAEEAVVEGEAELSMADAEDLLALIADPDADVARPALDPALGPRVEGMGRGARADAGVGALDGPRGRPRGRRGRGRGAGRAGALPDNVLLAMGGPVAAATASPAAVSPPHVFFGLEEAILARMQDEKERPAQGMEPPGEQQPTLWAEAAAPSPRQAEASVALVDGTEDTEATAAPVVADVVDEEVVEVIEEPVADAEAPAEPVEEMEEPPAPMAQVGAPAGPREEPAEEVMEPSEGVIEPVETEEVVPQEVEVTAEPVEVAEEMEAVEPLEEAEAPAEGTDEEEAVEEAETPVVEEAGAAAKPAAEAEATGSEIEGAGAPSPWPAPQ